MSYNSEVKGSSFNDKEKEHAAIYGKVSASATLINGSQALSRSADSTNFKVFYVDFVLSWVRNYVSTQDIP